MVYSSNEELNSKYQELCAVVGHLFISFGRLEGTLSAMLRLHLANNLGGHFAARSGIALSSAIYGSMRFKAARDTIRRLAKVSDVSAKVDEFLDDVFAQIGHVETLRDKLAHHIVTHSGNSEHGYWQVSDQAATRDIQNIKIHVFDDATVRAAASDLISATDRLGGLQGKELFSTMSLQPLAWLYKPSMLKHVRRGRARTRSTSPPAP